jgi:hypothetical protein
MKVILFAARDKRTGKLVNDITNPKHKFWEKEGNCLNAINNYKGKKYDLEMVMFSCNEVI